MTQEDLFLLQSGEISGNADDKKKKKNEANTAASVRPLLLSSAWLLEQCSFQTAFQTVTTFSPSC